MTGSIGSDIFLIVFVSLFLGDIIDLRRAKLGAQWSLRETGFRLSLQNLHLKADAFSSVSADLAVETEWHLLVETLDLSHRCRAGVVVQSHKQPAD